MISRQSGDPHAVVAELLTGRVRRESARGANHSTAEFIGHIPAGIRVARPYRGDIAEPAGTMIARAFPRGIIADYTVY